MSDSNAILEYSIEDKTILSEENGKFKCEVVPNDFTYTTGYIYKDGDIVELNSYPQLKAKIGLKVLLMRMGLIFKEIVIKNSFGSYTSIIYNDYLNLFYTSVSYSEDMSLYMSYRRALSDVIQGLNDNFIKSQNQSMEVLKETEVFNKLDFLYNKFCQDIEGGLIKDTVTAVDLNKDSEVNGHKVKFYELYLDLKKSTVHFVLGRIFNSKNEVLSERVYFNSNLSTAIKKVHYMLLEDLTLRQLYKDKIDWTADLDLEKIFNSCNKTLFESVIHTKISIKEASFEEAEKLRESNFYTKSLINYYSINKIKFEFSNPYIYSMFIVDTGFFSFKERTLPEKLVKFEDDNDVFWRNLVKRLNRKIKINYIGD